MAGRSRRYPMLRLVAGVYKFLAVIVFIMGLVAFIGSISGVLQVQMPQAQEGMRQMPGEMRSLMVAGGWMAGLVMLIFAVIVAVGLFAFAELICLAIDVEDNTRWGAELLERVERSVQSRGALG